MGKKDRSETGPPDGAQHKDPSETGPPKTGQTDSPKAGAADPNRWLADHGDAMFRYALLHLGDQTAAEDAVQEALLAGLQAAGGFAGRSSERTWLIGILRHKVVDHLRAKLRERPAADLGETDPFIAGLFAESGLWRVGPLKWSARADRAFEEREFWDVFNECRKRLPARMAAAFSLRELDALDADETCKLLGVSATNLWAMMHRARTRLRECLEEKWFGPGGRPGRRK